ncbi:MAG: thiamine pyrophosphate-binding protein [Chloroflexota bacterium]|nr:thiamine pyrophosphate-binding protein [Chloroflexota bacterium]
MPDVTVAEAIAAFLARQGVRRAYGVTGGEMLPVLDALQRHGIEFILTHHEAAAAYMADTEGQLTGRPGVCVSTLGPGAANLFAGLAQATLERSPVLGITADVTSDEAAGQRHQVYNIPGAMAPAVKYTARVSPDNLATVVPAAWSAAIQGMPGAAHLAVPSSTATLPVSATPVPSRNGAATPPPIPPELHDVEARLARASRPVAVLGLEARTPAIAKHFARLVGAADIPVITQVKARGWFPGSHRLHAGTLASYGSRGVFDLISGADLVLGVGMDGVDLVWPWDGPAGVNLTAHDTPDGSLPHTPIVGDVAAILERLAAVGRPDHRADGATRAAKARHAARADLQAGPAGTDHPADAPSDGIAVDPLFQTIRSTAPSDTALASDVGMHKLYLAQYWEAPRPTPTSWPTAYPAWAGRCPVLSRSSWRVLTNPSWPSPATAARSCSPASWELWPGCGRPASFTSCSSTRRSPSSASRPNNSNTTQCPMTSLRPTSSRWPEVSASQLSVLIPRTAPLQWYVTASGPRSRSLSRRPSTTAPTNA